ncbi:hypothetical protein ACQP1V_28140 [Microtetraspora malaysiensis]|uniref:hypothetical protein n=1 Tax=Microtetraspora malaysiensis TaxID=161358 RepID=UPI003D8F1871
MDRHTHEGLTTGQVTLPGHTVRFRLLRSWQKEMTRVDTALATKHTDCDPLGC